MPTSQITTFEQLISYIEEKLADNNSAAIDPSELRTSLLSLIGIQTLKNDLLLANFTPDQTVIWNNLIVKLEQIQQDAKSGTTGNAKQSNGPLNLSPYESYKVIEPITTAAAWYTAADATNKAKFPILQADLDINFIYFEVNNGVVSVFKSLKPVTSPAKLPLYSTIKTASIVTTTQFIDDENGNIIYRILTGQTLAVGELPANFPLKAQNVGTSLSQTLDPTNIIKPPAQKAVGDYVAQKIDGATIETTLIVSDFTPSINTSGTLNSGVLAITNNPSDGWGHLKLNPAIDDIKFQMTSNAFYNPVPNWFGVGFRNSKLIVLNIRTTDAQRGSVYEVLLNFGQDSTTLKSAFTTDNGAYTLAVGDWVRTKRVGSTIEVYKLVSSVWTLLGISDLSGLGITFGFSFVNSYVSAASTTLAIAKLPISNSYISGVNDKININNGKIAVLETTVGNKNLGVSRDPLATDITAFNGVAKITGTDITLAGNNTTDGALFYFNNNIRMIEFTSPAVFSDAASQYSIVISKKTGFDIFSYLGIRTTNTSPVISDYTATPDTQAIDGSGSFAAPNLPPEDAIVPIVAGDKIRILFDDNKIFLYIKKSGDLDFKKWFYFDKRGSLIHPLRDGLQGSFVLGYARVYSKNTTPFSAMVGVKVWEYKDNLGNVLPAYAKNIKDAYFNTGIPKLPYNLKWVAIGDSITAINENNKKGFIGIANNVLGYNLINKGFGGWTFYKLWKLKETADWITEILNADVVTISAGTNDFDTGFQNSTSDTQMDTYPDPHPRFGTFDTTSSDFKDPHTTLGSMRLMIDYILTNAPQARIIVTLPSYRLKKAIVAGVITTWTVNSEGRTIFDYADAIRKVATEYNLEYVDFIFNAGVNALNIDKYTYDKLHFNENGSRHFGNILLKKLINY